MKMKIRTAVMADLHEVTAVEAECFPVSEAADEEIFKARLSVYPNHFWLLEDDGTLIAFINGMVTDERTIRDEMFENAQLHNESGGWQAIFGVNTLPEFRRKGYAEMIMRHVIAQARGQGRKGCILTCKESLINYYQKFGYVNDGISDSVHGGAVWYNMSLIF